MSCIETIKFQGKELYIAIIYILDFTLKFAHFTHIL